MKKTILLLFLSGISILPALSQDIKLSQFDKRGIELIDSFMRVLNDHPDDEMVAAKAAMPYIHRSEYNNQGTQLMQDRLNFSFKKAWQNAKFYAWPVQVTRIQQQNLTQIGFGETAEAGKGFKVWIAKKEGVAGMPAPLNIFFPSDGSAPKLNYYGSL